MYNLILEPADKMKITNIRQKKNQKKKQPRPRKGTRVMEKVKNQIFPHTCSGREAYF